MLSKIKIIYYFLKIKLNKIFNLLLKTATAYIVASIALVQLSNIVVDNVSTKEILGLPPESFMQLLFIIIPSGFPLVLIAAYFIKRNALDNVPTDNPENTNTKTSDYKKKVGVIPFENLNNDDDGVFLVDGIVEDLITEFSMIKEISVATRKVCFGFRGKNYTSKNFKDEWGLDYVVSGSIRSIDNRIRISVELCDLDDESVIWSNKFDRVKIDIFDIQDEIVTKIINSMIGEIELSSLKRAHRKSTKNMTSYEFTLKGRALNQKFEKEANAEAIRMLDAAIEADKTNPLPYSWKACTIGQSMFMGFSEQTDELMASFLEALSKANELNDNDWNTNRILAEAHLTLHDFEQTKIYATKAYNANPNNPHVLSIYADSLLRTNESEKAVKIIEKMHELEPIPLSDSNSDRPLRALFFAHYLNKNFAKCRELFSQIQEIDIRTWLIFLDIESKDSSNFTSEHWFAFGINKFKDADWNMEINRFHLNDKDIKKNLIKLSTTLTTHTYAAA